MGTSLSERTTPELMSSPVRKSSTRCTLVHAGTMDAFPPAGAGAVFSRDAEEVASVAWENAAGPESANAIVPASTQPVRFVKVVAWLFRDSGKTISDISRLETFCKGV